MRILFHCWEFPPNGTGVATYSAAMSRALTEAGHRVVVVTGRCAGAPETEDGPCGLVLRRYSFAERYDVSVAEAVLGIAKTERIDWIECADHLGEGSTWMVRSPRPPAVLKLHSSNALPFVRDSEVLHGWQRPLVWAALLRNARQLRAERRSLRLAELLLCPSQRMRGAVLKCAPALGRRLTVVPNPFPPAPPGDPAPAPWPTLLFVGRLSIGKGIASLPTLLRGLVDRIPDVRLELAGIDSTARGLGSLRGWLTHQMGPLAHHVQFLGRLDAAALDAAYRRAWVVLVPSRWDNFPNSVLEAASRGLPVAASPHGGMAEMLEGTGCPIAEPSSAAFVEAVAALLECSELRQRTGSAARTRVNLLYHPRRIAAQYVEAVGEGLQRP